MLNRSGRTQRGFTLIELLAVMAIIAVLAAIIAPAVAGTRDASAGAQAAQDGIQVRTAAMSYFKDQSTIEVLGSQAAGTSAVALASVAETFTGSHATTSAVAAQKYSSRWPELLITSSSTSTNSVYYTEIPLSGSNDVGVVYVVDKDNKTIAAGTLFDGYTAVNAAKLVSDGYMDEVPDSAGSTVTVGNTAVHTFLWLFKKSTSPGSLTVDARDIVIFRLETAELVGAKYTLKYRQIF